MKRHTFSCLILFAALGAHAEVLTPAQALERAADLLPAKVGAERRMAARRSAEPILTIGEATPEVYVFGSAAGGLLVASADSETTPLLGYSEEYQADGELPPALKWLVGHYGQEIRARRNGDVVKRTMRRAANADFDPIEPICKTRWGQREPYCYDCPVDGDYYCVTGCVATAMAQVLKTYEYPARCSGGTFSYNWEYGNKTLSKNFNNVTLDWANMLDTYPSRPSASAATSKAVANLMSALGYASQMNYSPSASGANDFNCAEGLIRNFDYDYTIRYLYQDWFDLVDWQQKIYDELVSGHPVYYSGLNTKENVGHAFVVDGYNANGYFHVNWGWYGQLDGYYLLTALDPDGEQGVGGSSGGYSDHAGAMFNLSPGKTMTAAEAPLTVYSKEPLLVPAATTLGGKFPDNILVYNYAPFTVPQIGIALQFTHSNGDKYYSQPVGLGQKDPLHGAGGTLDWPIPANLPQGDYTIERIAYNPASDEIYDLYYDRGVNWRISATVSGKNITFSEYQAPLPDVLFFDSVEFPSVIYLDEEFSVRSYFVNPTKNTYTGRLHLGIYDKETNQDILGWHTAEFSLESMTYMPFNPKTSIPQSYLAPGDYLIGLSCDDESVEPFTAPVSIRMRRGDIKGLKFECTSQQINNVCFDLTLEALNYDYSGTITVVIGNAENATAIWMESFELNLAAGETIEKSFSEIDLTDKVEVGRNCMITCMYLTETNGKRVIDGDSMVYFTVTDPYTGLTPVSSSDSETEFFDLTGRRVDNPSTGVYIRRNGSNTQKITIR